MGDLSAVGRKLWMAERSGAPLLLMWCNCLHLSSVILPTSIQAECPSRRERECSGVTLWDETGSSAPFMLDGIEWWRNDMRSVHSEPFTYSRKVDSVIPHLGSTCVSCSYFCLFLLSTVVVKSPCQLLCLGVWLAFMDLWTCQTELLALLECNDSTGLPLFISKTQALSARRQLTGLYMVHSRSAHKARHIPLTYTFFKDFFCCTQLICRPVWNYVKLILKVN